MQSAICFTPILKERPWGGASLPISRLGLKNPVGSPSPIGESWEISDRPEALSIVKNGPWAGQSLHDLWTNHRELIFGIGYDRYDRFPILCKILDVQQNLSIQVHPTKDVAKRFGDEEKNEVWYVAQNVPHSVIYAGFSTDVSEELLASAVKDKTLGQLLQTYELNQGDSIDIPAGLVHSIGPGYQIYEIQQNSDTTYRLYDWDRKDAQGHSRELHQEQAIASVLASHNTVAHPRASANGVISEHPWFRVEDLSLASQASLVREDPQHFSIVVVVSGNLVTHSGDIFNAGDFLLVPAQNSPILAGSQGARLLMVSVPPHL